MLKSPYPLDFIENHRYRMGEIKDGVRPRQRDAEGMITVEQLRLIETSVFSSKYKQNPCSRGEDMGDFV